MVKIRETAAERAHCVDVRCVVRSLFIIKLRADATLTSYTVKLPETSAVQSAVRRR